MSTQLHPNKASEQILQSDYVSRDLSWFQFNYRVLDQSTNEQRSVFERLKFLAITASNFDEFAMIRIGSLYNYLDYGKERVDYSGLREKPFKTALFNEAQNFFAAQTEQFKKLMPEFITHDFEILGIDQLTDAEKERTAQYFKKTVYPMLTPMLVDIYHTFPVVMNKALTFGVVTQNLADTKHPKRLSFVQIPQNLPRFFEIQRADTLVFVPIEEIVRWRIFKLYKNIEILSVNLFRVTRNGDISIEESDDIEADFVDEVRRKLSTRRTGRVVRVEVEDNYSSYMMKILKQRWEIDYDNIFVTNSLMDFTGLWQIVNHPEFKEKTPVSHASVLPLSAAGNKHFDEELFDILKQRDILMHHPYNSMEPVVSLIEQAADDPKVLSIKMTIYRLAKNSRITNALLKAVENGKHVAVLFEVKARFDEENNIREAKKLQKAGCFVIYGVSSYKTHTKMMLIVRKEDERITRYVHLSSGNYNESTAKLYTDIGLLTTNEVYANDVSEFFNAITGHSVPDEYKYLITAPRDMRNQLIELIRQEAENARNGLPSGIVIKVNSLEDKATIDELYKASQAGVTIKLIVRGICCLRPHRKGLSDNITVRSIVGDLLEHTRIYYFHNGGNPKVYGGSADMMNRSFDRRLESLFLIVDEKLKQEAINILAYNVKDNVNSHLMHEDGTYHKRALHGHEKPFNIHQEFYDVTEDVVMNAKLF
ncbi:polyphosphate kinase [Flexibacter flexilis DSM 6793]|uniref:Polyphosphate kinase n=1 Tax=Flexibacter flexilis DSM 6793 TaxID=927664 RepID=A0A1I1LBB8_9BACT|nr:polyphosphate kinase 1 [Flexibacter flexilis]SFC67673.1 polyphosphate kinase [Flexibacter flexilis DSM 6793]